MYRGKDYICLEFNVDGPILNRVYSKKEIA